MTLKDLPVFFLDLQTTGAKPSETSHILEIAWGLSESTEIKSSLITQPEDQPVPRRILSLTGIRAEEMTESKNLIEVFTDLATTTVARPAVIHFAQFEKPFIKDAIEKFNAPENSSAANPAMIEFPIICTHQIAKRLFPNLPARGIKGLAGYFGHYAGEVKRATGHVEATKVIWQHLVEALTTNGIHTFDELQNWLATEVPKKRTKYEYPMAKEKRLSLPDEPGVYRYISQWGEILYVGKATSLKDRVNSYFRGQKNRDHRKLEMLTQAWDIRVTVCRSPLESALLETDEIKTHNPRYNISLKAGERALIFFSHNFTSASTTQDEVHTIGPFSSATVFESVLKLAACLREEEVLFDPEMFFEVLEPELLEEGYNLFCATLNIDPKQFASMRSIIAQGLIFARADREDEAQEELLAAEEEAETEEGELTEEDLILTAEDIADKFRRHFKRSAYAYLRARKLTKFLNADIEYNIDADQPKYLLHFRNGLLSTPETPPTTTKHPWAGMNIDTYDRMSILLSELTRIASREGAYELR
jgi:DNA polymerase-3 subunit epsilon